MTPKVPVNWGVGTPNGLCYKCLRSLYAKRTISSQVSSNALALDPSKVTTGQPDDDGPSDENNHEDIARSNQASESFGRPRRSRGRPIGSKSQSRRPKVKCSLTSNGLYKPLVPRWFIEENVKLAKILKKTEISTSATSILADNAIGDVSETKLGHPDLDKNIWQELMAHIRTALTLGTSISGHRYHRTSTDRNDSILLLCPQEGGTFYLNEIIEHAGAHLDVDIIRIDPQDLQQLAGNLYESAETNEPMPLSFRSLGYLAARRTEQHQTTENEDYEDPSEDMDGETDDYNDLGVRPGDASGRKLTPVHLLTGGQDRIIVTPADVVSNEVSLKLRTLLNALIDAKKSLFTLDQKTRPVSSKTIVYVREINLLQDGSGPGSIVLRALETILYERRRRGESIMMVGSASISAIPEDLILGEGFVQVNSVAMSNVRSVVIPPPSDNRLASDNIKRMKQINLRHLSEEIRRRQNLGHEIEIIQGINPESTCARVGNGIWSYDKVQRIVSILLGQTSDVTVPIITEQLNGAILLADRVNDLYQQWKDSTEEKAEIESEEQREDARKMGRVVDTKTSKLNRYEKKLVLGIVRKEALRDGFSSVQAPEKTIKALKTIVSLSLIRPDAFKYGILARNHISGILLFGPPGSGKTLLAKAVAKESGANVIELKGSDIFDMYVGEGEKNVKAIFSLARKLSPCVIFLDEVDAVFGSRRSDHSNPSHREVINQFMAEWDGIQSQNDGVLLMGATNRPFDLDDAIIRRMPRRILVDLASEADRREIIKIHLREETVDAAVDIETLVKQTNFYSGSDLRNLVISAALNAVNEENEIYATGETRSHRILSQRHFDMALNEISPSINADMSVLTEIRKWDAKFGDGARANHRKAVWGFSDLHNLGNGRIRT